MKKLLVLPALLLIGNTGFTQKWAKEYVHVNEIACGLSLVEKDGKHGYVDKDGKIIIPLMYDEGMNFTDGFAGIMIENKWGFIDSTGKVIVEPQFTDVYSFNEGMAAVAMGDAWGFIDNAGKIVIPMNYTNARCFSSGLAPVSNKKLEWGYIDKNGKVVIPFQYGFADRFRDGIARVMKGGNWSYINPEGKMVKVETEQ